MLIYEALKKDHDEVKQLLKKLIHLDDTEVKQRHRLVDQIRDALIPHSRAEEAVLYNSLRMIEATGSIPMHAYLEHLQAETLLRLLQVEDKIDVSWRATAEKLKEMLEHHIHEEEDGMFASARQLFTTQEAEVMAIQFENLKPQIRKEGFVGTTMDLVTNLIPPQYSDGLQVR